MPIFNRKRFLLISAIAISLASLAGCKNSGLQPEQGTPAPMSSVPAVRLNFRFEPDVPAPAGDPDKASSAERDPVIQADFDATRPLELLDRTLASPDKKRVIAIYHRISDILSEYRLDMYSADGKLMRKLTSETMAVHFPETIVWSPDSTTLAYVAMIRAGQLDTASGATPPGLSNLSANTQVPMPGSNSNSNAAPKQPAEPEESPTPVGVPTPPPPTGILTFRSEQIYTCGSDGIGIKALTENEGLIYFYYAWSPDSTMLVALATTAREWKYLDVLTTGKGETMTPQGRPRIIEKNGRERRLDDNQTSVRPVWSPDSTKVAAGFDTQIRIYDAAGTNPTQAAIPLRNQLLISSQAYDRDQQIKLQAANTSGEANAAAPIPADQPSTLPDEKLLVSYNPIVEIAWPEENLIYLQTAYVKRMRNEADTVRSFSRWHRLPLTAQFSAPVR